MFESYYQVREWLEGFIPFTYSKKILGLGRIKYLLKLLDNPQHKFKSIHVAGTSGKGSTAFYIARLLRESESKRVKVGLSLSPHLVDIRERMQIFGKEPRNQETKKPRLESLMPMGRFLRLFDQVKPVVEKIKKTKSDLTPSYFEILVAASFLYFAQEKVDWAIVEVGLGGRLDATNILKPKLCVITNVGLDHTDILGKSIEEIAYEKAGIIKSNTKQETRNKKHQKGISVVTGATGKALEVIEKVAKDKNVPLITIDTQKGLRSLKSDIKDYLIKYYDILRHSPQNFVLENALLAIAALKILKVEATELGLKKVLSISFAGRLEPVDDRVIIDGAHNPDKIKVLINWIKTQLTTNNLQLTKRKEKNLSFVNCHLSIVLVVAFKKGKDWRKMLDLLLKDLPVKEVVATKFYAVTDMGRYQAVEPREIKSYIESKSQRVRVMVLENSHEAVWEALSSLHTPGVRKVSSRHTPGVGQELVLVTGSLYLVGEVRTIWHLSSFA